MAIIKVVCGIIFQDDKIFICRRKREKTLGGYWEFPGGKIEIGESNEDSLTRELKEELGMTVTVGNHFQTVLHSYETQTIELIAYVCYFQQATYLLTDHDRYEWVDRLTLLQKPLAPADIPIARSLMQSSSII
jgi:8-oxo-dGTP diphosphatase